MLKIFKTGHHAKRSPISYPALFALFADSIQLLNDPRQADIFLFSHELDIQNISLDLVEEWRKRRPLIVLLSEEPFWDTIWGKKPGQRHCVVDTPHGLLPVVQLNHTTSAIFHFDRIPYYLLSDHRFAARYQARFERNAARSPKEWQAHFASAPLDISYMFERRPEAYHSVEWPQYDIIGLCHWRTQVAEHSTTEAVARFGKSWNADVVARQSLRDWHLDKLARQDSQQRIFAAFENTHHPHYITEKMFDAFACGAVPAYFASDKHRIHEFELPSDSWINCANLSPQSASIRLAETAAALKEPTLAFCQDYAAAQDALWRLFNPSKIWKNERQRLKNKLLKELTLALDHHPA